MKKLISLMMIILLTALSISDASSLAIGEESVNIYSGYGECNDPGMYYSYLEKQRKERGNLYTHDQLRGIYEQISFYLLNRTAMSSDNKGFESLINSITFVGLRDDEKFNCVEVIIEDLNPNKADMFREYICDSDAVILWGSYLSNAPSGYDDFSVSPRQATSFKLKSGKSANIPIANKSKVKLWKSSNTKAVTVAGGAAVGLSKGSSVVTAVYSSALEVRLNYEVTDNPRLSKSSITVKKGKSKSVKILGKAAVTSNKYTKTKRAKITSKKSASTIKIKGLKKGKTTLSITVNNSVKLKLKVKIKN